MDIPELVQTFLGSQHGQAAAAELAQQGFDEGQVQDILTKAGEAGAAHIEQAHQDGGGFLGEHAGMSFFAAFASGMAHGDGVLGALEDGAIGVVIGRITEALTGELGIDSGAADAAAAATAPYVMSFLREHLGL